MDEAGVVDASALVDLLLRTDQGQQVDAEFSRFATLHAPAHVDAEVLSALGRLHRAGHVGADVVTNLLETLARAPIQRHALTSLVSGAWQRRDRFRLVDALNFELSERLGASLLTTDGRLAAAAGITVILP